MNETDNGQNEETFSIITKTKFNDQVANAILDSGAGPSVMDLGTFESLGISSEIKQLTECKDVLRDASDNQMDILGIPKLNEYKQDPHAKCYNNFVSWDQMEDDGALISWYVKDKVIW